MANIKYFPAIVTGITVVLVLLAFDPLYQTFHFIFRIPAELALALSLFTISVCVMFLIGLGTNKKQFLCAACFMSLGIFLILLVFL